MRSYQMLLNIKKNCKQTPRLINGQLQTISSLFKIEVFRNGFSGFSKEQSLFFKVRTVQIEDVDY